SVTAPGQVFDRFDPPPIRFDHRGRFCVPGELTGRCGRHLPGQGPPPETPLALCPPWTRTAGGLLFDQRGRPASVEEGESPGPPPYLAAGTWLSQALDSEIYRCQWHRLELDVTALPPGSVVAVNTYADQERRPGEEIEALPEH